VSVAEQNIEAAKRFTEALQRNDLDAAAVELGPRFEVDDQDIPDADGHDSLYTWIGRWNEAFDSWRISDDEWIPVGEDRVLCTFRMHATGKGSGLELTRDDATVTEFEHSKIVRIGYYNDQAQAREAVGVDPPAGAGLRKGP
jgi:hypothetical protein